MSLYRTWRPKTFADLVGQDAVVRTLSTALETGKLAHAYLFSGPRGSGKTSAAKILARCIECVNGPTATPDNTCGHCLAIAAGTALDVLEIDAASNRGIDEIRALRDAVKFPPAAMRSKVYIIDEAHMLTKEGANAFLKTLEEPPEWAVFVLATTAPEALPPTILSRCQRYAFRRISVAVMIERMRTIAGAESITIDDAALSAIAYRADGGLRDALTMLEQVAAFSRGPIDPAVVDAAFGMTSREFAYRLVRAILAGDAGESMRIVDEASEAGADISGLVRNVMAEFRHLLVARVNRELLARDLSTADAEAALELAQRTPQAKIVRALRLLSDALAATRTSGQPRIELETVALRLTLQGEDPSLEALAARVAQLERALGSAAPPTPPDVDSAVARLEVREPEPAAAPPIAPPPQRAARPASAPVAPRATATAPAPSKAAVVPAPAVSVPAERAAPGEALTVQKIRSIWQNVRMRVESQRAQAAGPLSRTRIESLEAETLTLSVPDATNGTLLRANVEALSAAIADITGCAVKISVRVDAGGQAPPGIEAPSGEDIDLMDYSRRKLG